MKILKHLPKSIQLIKRFVFSKNNVACPCCHNEFVTFLPTAGQFARPHAACPIYSSLERHRMMILYLERETSVFEAKNIKILHIAPEPHLFNRFLKAQGSNYHPVDLFTGSNYYPPPTANMDITNIGGEANVYDVILCSHVLEHIPDDTKAMSELYRVLKPSGFAILQVPMEKNRAKTYEDWSITTPAAREVAFYQNDHVRIYGNDYQDRLRSVGFEVTIVPYTKQFSALENFKYGFDVAEDIYLCKKI